MENYCKSFDAETFLRHGEWTNGDQKLPLVKFTPENMTTRDCSAAGKDDSVLRPAVTHVETRGKTPVPWELTQAIVPAEIKDSIVVYGTPAGGQGAIRRIETEKAGYIHYVQPEVLPVLPIEENTRLKYDIEENDRLIKHAPAVESKFPREFLNNGTLHVPIEFGNEFYRPTRFDRIQKCGAAR
jgi:hypothetical protein